MVNDLDDSVNNNWIDENWLGEILLIEGHVMRYSEFLNSQSHPYKLQKTWNCWGIKIVNIFEINSIATIHGNNM